MGHLLVRRNDTTTQEEQSLSNRLGELEVDEAAHDIVGNWKRFQCFIWFRDDIDDADNWAIIYLSHRDSGLLDQSNASVIRRSLESYTDGDDPDVVMESHSHFLVGHIDGFSVRVFRNGEITDAFREYHRLAESMANYPILDDEDYSNRESEATADNIADAARRLKDDYELPEDWQWEVYSWLSENDPGAIENRDDQGGYPHEISLRVAFTSLGYEQEEPACG